MFNFIKSLFVTDPAEKIKKERDRKYKEAVHFQRNGKLREYAEVMKEIEDLEKKYVEAVSEEV
tara:strand:+ start:657 stop:845 length:189 start_codon:yes stop_codon:yes gene_type:complete